MASVNRPVARDGDNSTGLKKPETQYLKAEKLVDEDMDSLIALSPERTWCVIAGEVGRPEGGAGNA